MAQPGGAELEVHVLGHPKEEGAEESHLGQLAACPFSARVLLLLEEKELPYTPNFVSSQHKPAWVAKVNPAGTLPIVRDLSSGQWLPDSDAISDFLEDKFSSAKPLGKLADCPTVAPKLWPAFLALLAAGPGGGAEAQAAKKELAEQLQEVERRVSNDAPFIGGQAPCAADFAVAPRLYLAREGARLLLDWDVCADGLGHCLAYLHRMTGRPAWRNTASWDADSIAADLRRKLGGAAA